MYKKRTLLLLAAVLIAEAIAFVALPGHVPRAVRSITGAVNVVAAVALILLARKRA
jgi:hypothetical protein